MITNSPTAASFLSGAIARRVTLVYVVEVPVVVVVTVVEVVLLTHNLHSTGQLSEINWSKISLPQSSSVIAFPYISVHTSGSGSPLQTGGMQVPHRAGHSSLTSQPVVNDALPHCVLSKRAQSSTSGTP